MDRRRCKPCVCTDKQDGLHVEVLDLRAHVWGVEQDLSKIVKHGMLCCCPLRRVGDDEVWP